jgi:hypothetical protein
MADGGTREEIAAEMRRTAYQKKAVARMTANEVLDFAIEFFKERGYRAGRTGRPNQAFVMGGKEGALPRVTGEIKVQSDVGKARVTMVTMDATGAMLGQAMEAFHKALRSKRTT